MKKRADSPHPNRVTFAKSPEKSASEGEGAVPPQKGTAQKGVPVVEELKKEEKNKERGLELRAPSPAAGKQPAREGRTSPARRVNLRERLKEKGRST